MVSGGTSVEVSVPQRSIFGPLLWNNDFLQCLPVASAYAVDCALSHSYTRKETANDDILAWGRRWQVRFAAERTQAILITHSRNEARLLAGQLWFGDDTLATQNSINILGVEVDSKLSFDCHLEIMTRKASLRVTFLLRVRHLLDADGLLKLYKEGASKARHGVQPPHLDE